jgi:hypothetical protein
MRVDLFLILLLHTEDDLYRDMLGWVRWLKLIPGIDPDLRSAFYSQLIEQISLR